MSQRQVLNLAVALFIMILLGALVKPHSESAQGEAPPEIIDPHSITAFLSEQMAQAEPGSPEALKFERLIKKVKMKAEQKGPRQENPGALIEAFAQIKSDSQGRGYQPGYRVAVIEKSRKAGRFAKKRADWTEIGPANVSGRVRTVVIDPDDPTLNTWFIASIGGGVWKTSDGGNSWRHLTADLGTLCITTLVQAQSNPNVLYAGTGMGYGRVVDLIGSGIWKSTDRGESWTQLASTANGQLLEAINRIVVDPNDEDVVVVCSNDGFSHLGPKGGTRKSGIFRSTDGGISWTQTFDPDVTFGTNTDNRVQQIVADPNDFNRLYATVNEVGVVRSFNGGQSWSVSANTFADPNDVGNPSGDGFGLAGISVRIEMAVSPSDTSRLYAAVERPRGVADLYMSTNGGNSWSLVTDTGNDPNWFNSFGMSGADGSYTAGWFDNCIAVHPSNPNVVYVGGVNIYRLDINPSNGTRSSTLSAYWIPNNFGVARVHADHHWLEIVPNSSAPAGIRILNGNDGGVALSDDGGVTWTEFRGMRTSQFYGAAKKPGENVYIAGAQDNGSWVSGSDPDISSPWQSVIGGDGFEAVWHAKDPNLVLGNSQFNGYARSTDGGVTFTSARPNNVGLGPFITKIGYGNSDPDLVFAVSNSGISRSDDFGVTWTLTPVDGNWIGFRPFDNVEVSEADPQVVWISSRLDVDPASGLRGGIHVSTDGGLSFSEVSANFPAGLTEASGMAPHPTEPNTCYVLFSAPGNPKVLRTEDLGQSWTDLSGFVNGVSNHAFPDVAVFDLQAMPFDSQILWAATEIGLFVSENGGQSWAFDNSMPHVAIFELKIQEEQILASTQGRGIWTARLPEMAGYKYPEATLPPRLSTLALDSRGNLQVGFDARSAYDEVQLLINGEVQEVFPSNAEAFSDLVLFPQSGDTTANAQVVALKDGRTFKSPIKQVTLKARDAARTYSNTFDAASDEDFLFNGFALTNINGLSSQVLATAIPYPNNSDLTATLGTPLTVPESNAIMRFDEFALVEPGTGSGTFGDPQFWDYVIVEGSTDGIQWTQLLDGYDARAFSDWLGTYTGTGSGVVPSLFKTREINLLETFAAGDQVMVRFRLHADSAVNGFGWVIDNLAIFPDQQDKALTHETLYCWVSQNDLFESILVVNNPSDQMASFTLTALREGGSGERTVVRSLAPRQFLATSPAELFPSLGDGAGLSIRLASDSSAIRGRWVTNNLTAATGASPSQGVGVDINAALAGNSEQAGSRIIFNYLPQSAGMTAAPVLVNVGNEATDVTLSFYDQSGRLLLRDRETLVGLQPNRPFARVVSTLLDTGGEDVYLVAESNGAPITGVSFIFNAQGETSIGNAVAVIENNDPSLLLYAWVSNNEDFESIVVANNLRETPADVSLTARRADGSLENTVRTIPAGGFLAEQASSLFPSLADGSGYTVQLNSDSSGLYGAWVTNNLKAASGQSPAQGVAVTVPNGDGQAGQQVGEAILYGYLPGSNGLISAPVVVNLNPAPVDVELQFFNRVGEQIHSEILTALDTHQPYAVVVQSLIADLHEDVYMTARSSGGLITGVAFVFNGGSEPAIGNVSAIE